MAAIDLESGGLVVAVPEAFRLREMQVGARRFLQGNDRLEIQRRHLDLVWVRRKVGMWLYRGRDGEADDDDGARDGKVTAAVDRFVALLEGGESPPGQFGGADTFVAIDPRSLEFFLVRLEG